MTELTTGDHTPTGTVQRPPSTAKTWKGLGASVSRNPGLGTVHSGSLPRRYAVTNLDFDVTENCNLGCLYCFKGEMYTQNMSIDTMKRALEWLLLVTLPGNFGHPRTRGTREDVRHAPKSTTQVHTRTES